MAGSESILKVEAGWSGELGSSEWVRHTVTLEEDDWQAFCQEKEITKVPLVALKYSWMQNEATVMLCAWMKRHAGPDYQESVRATIEDAMHRRTKLLEMLTDNREKEDG